MRDNYPDTGGIVEIKEFPAEQEKGKFKKIEDDIAEINEAVEQMHNSLLEKMKAQKYEHHFKFSELEFARWMTQNVPANALRAAIEMLDCTLATDRDWRTSMVLDNILDLFKQAREGKIKLKPDANLASDLMTILNKLPEKHNVMRDSIISALMETKK